MGFKLVAFDLDGVLVEEPSAWWTLHHAFGTYESSRDNLRAYERGVIDYPEFMRRDIGLWGTRKINEIENILLKFTLTHGAPDVCDLLHQRGYQLAVVSAGIDILAKTLSEKLRIDGWIANGLEVDAQGFLTGEGVFRVDLRENEKALSELLKPLRAKLSDAVGVGDSKYDVPFMCGCGAGVALVKSNCPERTHAWAKGWVTIWSLRELPKALSAIEEQTKVIR